MNGRPHPGDCPHHPDERIKRDDPFTGRFQDECGVCGLKGQQSGNRRDARHRFELAVTRARRERRFEDREERHLDSVESLMKAPPGATARVLRGRRL